MIMNMTTTWIMETKALMLKIKWRRADQYKCKASFNKTKAGTKTTDKRTKSNNKNKLIRDQQTVKYIIYCTILSLVISIDVIYASLHNFGPYTLPVPSVLQVSTSWKPCFPSLGPSPLFLRLSVVFKVLSCHKLSPIVMKPNNLEEKSEPARELTPQAWFTDMFSSFDTTGD